ncbi:hypothetical protein [Micromonospora okii]|uniref:hypothetical protein n=1 Tax=Micromonospora okii TaxID=1182970 RepID=UPI001E2D60BE|nr:hypothetical protein [Micromonospora okii]
MRTRHPGRWRIFLVAALTVAPVTACGTEPEAGGRPVAAGTKPPAHSEADEKAAREAALAAYSGYLKASRAASQRSDPRHPELVKFLADPLLTRVRLAIRDAKEHGAVRTGTLVSDPTVISVSLDTVPATVDIQDCLDSSRYRLVYSKTKRVVPGSGGGRHLATATAARYPDGRWLINAGVGHEDQPC